MSGDLVLFARSRGLWPLAPAVGDPDGDDCGHNDHYRKSPNADQQPDRIPRHAVTLTGVCALPAREMSLRVRHQHII